MTEGDGQCIITPVAYRMLCIRSAGEVRENDAVRSTFKGGYSQKMADFLDAFYWSRRGCRCGRHAGGSDREKHGHGCDAAVFSKAAVGGRSVSEFCFFRHCPADCQRPDQPDGCVSAVCPQTSGFGLRHDVWHYADALDLHSVLYVPAEFYVHNLFCLRRRTGGDGVRGDCF